MVHRAFRLIVAGTVIARPSTFLFLQQIEQLLAHPDNIAGTQS
jgi:hypothetical protein